MSDGSSASDAADASDTPQFDDPRLKACDGCGAPVKPAAGYLGGPIKCLDCLEEAK